MRPDRDKPTEGDFARGGETLPQDKHVGSFAEGEAREPLPERKGSFAPEKEEDQRVGSFADAEDDARD